jgi:hypothetical protein
MNSLIFYIRICGKLDNNVNLILLYSYMDLQHLERTLDEKPTDRRENKEYPSTGRR